MDSNARKSAVEVVEDMGPDSRRNWEDSSCPACGAPNGRVKCQKCGWGAEDLEPRFSDTVTDPVATIRDARIEFKNMKEEAAELRKKNELLVQNNRKFSELVEVMEQAISRQNEESGKRYAYSYAGGGWGEKGADGKMLIHLRSDVTVQEINRQLAEILGLIGKYRK